MSWRNDQQTNNAIWDGLYGTVEHNINFIYISSIVLQVHYMCRVETIIRDTNTKILKWERYLANMYQEKGPLFFNCCHLQKFHTIIEYVSKTQNFVKIIILLVSVFLREADVSNMVRFSFLLHDLKAECLVWILCGFNHCGPGLVKSATQKASHGNWCVPEYCGNCGGMVCYIAVLT